MGYFASMDIAPNVEDGSFIHRRGEDGAERRWVINSGAAREDKAAIIWIEGEEA